MTAPATTRLFDLAKTIRSKNAGVDRINNAMHNVSIWQSVADANQMATFAPMLALAGEFTAIGVHFERPILNFETLWQID